MEKVKATITITDVGNGFARCDVEFNQPLNMKDPEVLKNCVVHTAMSVVEMLKERSDMPMMAVSASGKVTPVTMAKRMVIPMDTHPNQLTPEQVDALKDAECMHLNGPWLDKWAEVIIAEGKKRKIPTAWLCESMKSRVDSVNKVKNQPKG